MSRHPSIVWINYFLLNQMIYCFSIWCWSWQQYVIGFSKGLNSNILICMLKKYSLQENLCLESRFLVPGNSTKILAVLGQQIGTWYFKNVFVSLWTLQSTNLTIYKPYWRWYKFLNKDMKRHRIAWWLLRVSFFVCVFCLIFNGHILQWKMVWKRLKQLFKQHWMEW